VNHPHTHTSNIKCFKCLRRGHIATQYSTNRATILRGIDYYSRQEESSSSESESKNLQESHG